MAKNGTLREQYVRVKHHRHWHTWPVVRNVRAMAFRRLRPFNAGQSDELSVIRYYWADFLEQHRADIRGRALEIGETSTLRAFGGDALTEPEALDLSAHSDEVTLVGDLSRGNHLPAARYDCFVNQFTTAVIYDIDAAVYHAVRLLKPGGVLLINFWCVDFYLYRGLDMGTGAPLYMYHWFTPIGAHNLFHRVGLTEADYQLDVYGNLLTRMAFLLNVPARDFTPAELAHADPGQPLLICARVVKPANWSATCPAYVEPQWTPQTAPAQLRPDTGHYGDAYL
jgi:SAM-dependent methyltransferase